jgi:hypothetical protein
MDSLVRTISRGYVKKTEVMPAAPPQTRRLTEVMSPPGEFSKNYLRGSADAATFTFTSWLVKPHLRGGNAYLLIEVIAPELDRRIWHDTYAICSVSSHESSPTFVLPHLHEALSN